MGMGPYWFGTLPTYCSVGMGPFPMTCKWDSYGMGMGHPHLFGVKVVAVLSVGVPVLDADGGPPLTAADLRDAVIPQP